MIHELQAPLSGSTRPRHCPATNHAAEALEVLQVLSYEQPQLARDPHGERFATAGAAFAYIGDPGADAASTCEMLEMGGRCGGSLVGGGV